MKHTAAVVASVLLLFTLLYCAWVRADAASQVREEFAQELTREYGEHIACYASGPFGKRLVVIPRYGYSGPGLQADCDAAVDPLVLDKETMSEFHRDGFTSIQCGAREVRDAKN